jgi:hypothetical protein
MGIGCGKKVEKARVCGKVGNWKNSLSTLKSYTRGFTHELSAQKRGFCTQMRPEKYSSNGERNADFHISTTNTAILITIYTRRNEGYDISSSFITACS